MKIAVLAVQGAFIEHEKRLKKLGAEVIELRKGRDAEEEFDGLVLPGGESTVQGKLLRELGMFYPLQKRIEAGLPVLATCAGLILLAENISNDDRRHFATLPVTVRRNAYGRQLESFFAEGRFGDMENVPMEFIRAPYIESVGEGVEVLSRVIRPSENQSDDRVKEKNVQDEGEIVAVRYRNQLAMSFHPELCSDTRIHEEFLGMI